MAYRATPNTTTGYSPFFLLHGREMTLPSNEDLKAKVGKDDRNLKQRIANLKSTLKLAYRSVRRANQKAYQTNKKYYDRKAKPREFKVGDFAYLYNPAIKPGLSRKFKKPWEGPFEVIARKSDINYEILNRNRKQVVHINRLKPAYGYVARQTKAITRRKKQPRKHPDTCDGIVT
jgi:hypothetical protein